MFCQSVFEFLGGADPHNLKPTIEEVPGGDTRSVLTKVVELSKPFVNLFYYNYCRF